MSQGVAASFSFLVDHLQALTPKTDASQGFVCVDPATGQELLTDRRPNTLRLFELRVTTFPHDDGQSGITGRKRLTAELRVRYDIPRDVGLLERIVGEDSSQLVNSLREPSYSLATTGITSLITGEASTAPILDEAGNPAALLLVVPFDLLYAEAF